MSATEFAALLGAFGFGAVATKLLDVLWLQRVMAASERAKWMREQRYHAFSLLTREIISQGPFHHEPSEVEFKRLVADVLLLVEDPQLTKQLHEYLPQAYAARSRLDHFTNNGTSTVEERTALRAVETQAMRQRAERLVQDLRDSL